MPSLVTSGEHEVGATGGLATIADTDVTEDATIIMNETITKIGTATDISFGCLYNSITAMLL